MRLWTLHPSMLDTKGLVACWRESLLAKKVLENRTKGYKNHPQLNRFKESGKPLEFINAYLYFLGRNACDRGYSFDLSKIDHDYYVKWQEFKQLMPVTSGQCQYEIDHLKRKCYKRDRDNWKRLHYSIGYLVNPIFEVTKITDVPESWEVVKGNK